MKNFFLGILDIKRPTSVDPDSVFFKIGVKIRKFIKG